LADLGRLDRSSFDWFSFLGKLKKGVKEVFISKKIEKLAVGYFSVFALSFSFYSVNPAKAQSSGCPPAYPLYDPSSGQCYNGGINPNTLEATCATQGAQKPELCYKYYQMNCQRGFRAACWMVQAADNNWGYYITILQENTSCLSGNREACAWMQAQNIPN
jgi:hypothetical protein